MSGYKSSEPVQVDLLENLKFAEAAQKQRIQAQARPGESWQEAADRIRKEEKQRQQAAAPSIRRPPKGDAQPDFFVPMLYDVGTRDSRSIMDVAEGRPGFRRYPAFFNVST
jgi:hypothetical protein